MIGNREIRIDGTAAFGPSSESGDAATLPQRRIHLPAPTPTAGFRAQLDDASLWDLVQMECLTRARRVIQVTGEAGAGYLYFSAGRVIHAVTPRLSGMEAALEILSWTNGNFQPCERSWPSTPTIEASQETLILLAAKRRDEAEASNNLVAFRAPSDATSKREAPSLSEQPSQTQTQLQLPQQTQPRVRQQRGTDAPAEEDVEYYEIEEGSMSEIRKPIINSSITPVPMTPMGITRNEPLSEFSVMIRVAANGTIVKNKGGNEELAGVVAYTQMLVQLVGELLGLEPFQAMECTFKDKPDQPAVVGGPAAVPSRCLMFTEANGDVVALRPRPDSNIQPLRESLGL